MDFIDDYFSGSGIIGLSSLCKCTNPDVKL